MPEEKCSSEMLDENLIAHTLGWLALNVRSSELRIQYDADSEGLTIHLHLDRSGRARLITCLGKFLGMNVIPK